MENAPATTTNTAAADPLWLNGLTRSEWYCVFVTIGIVSALSIAAWCSYEHRWVVRLALSLGAVGGILHEIAQSGGKILSFQKQEDGIFLGSLGGALIGAIAGFLAVKTIAIAMNATTTPGNLATDPNMMQIAYDVFLAGLGLKGVVEAAVGTPVKKTTAEPAPPTDPNPPEDK